MNPVSTSRLLDICIAASQAAGRHATDHYARRTETIEVGAHDLKLALDVECQGVASAVIRREFPDHALLGEERGLREDGEYRWVIDPIDGTVNFSHGVPYWGNSIAVQHHGRTIAGAVSLPMLGEIYTATADGPATLNGAPVRVSDTAGLDRSIIYTGMIETDGDDGVSMRVTMRLATEVQKLRILGSAAAELCYVACGRGDGYVETTIHLWDLAAGALFVERAGGTCEVLEDLGDYTMRFLASNGRIHAARRKATQDAMGK